MVDIAYDDRFVVCERSGGVQLFKDQVQGKRSSIHVPTRYNDDSHGNDDRAVSHKV